MRQSKIYSRLEYGHHNLVSLPSCVNGFGSVRNAVVWNSPFLCRLMTVQQKCALMLWAFLPFCFAKILNQDMKSWKSDFVLVWIWKISTLEHIYIGTRVKVTVCHYYHLRLKKKKNNVIGAVHLETFGEANIQWNDAEVSTKAKAPRQQRTGRKHIHELSVSKAQVP